MINYKRQTALFPGRNIFFDKNNISRPNNFLEAPSVNKSWLFFLFLLIFLLPSYLQAAAPLFECDFTLMPPKDKMLLTRNCSVENGVLTIGMKTGKFYPEVATFQSRIDTPFILSFSMRVTGVAQPDPLHQLGIALLGPNDLEYKFCSRDGGSYVVLAAKGKEIIDRKTFSGKVNIETGDNVRLVPVKLRIDAGLIEMEIDGSSIGAVPLAFMPIEKINFFASNMQIQIDDVKIEKIALKPDNYVKDPVFYAPFDNSAEAVIEGGKRISPAATAGEVKFTEGAKKQGVNIDKEDLTYNVRDLFGNAGAVMFWIKPSEKTVFQTIYFQTDDGKNRLVCRAQGYAFSINLYDRSGLEKEFLMRGNKYLFFNADLYHYAVTWNKTGEIRIFRNGMPYIPGCAWEPQMFFSADCDLSDVRKVVVSKRCNSLIDDLIIYRRNVAPEEVYDACREASPIDVVAPCTVIQPAENAEVVLSVAPGGYYTRAVHGNRPYIEAEGELSLALYSMDKANNATPFKTLKEKIKVGQTPLTLKFPAGKLPEGEYRLQWEFISSSGMRSQKSIAIEVAGIPVAEKATDKDVELGEVVFEKKFSSVNDKTILSEGNIRAVDDKYLEAGSKNGDRLAVVVPNLEKFIQKPMILEIIWPDDKQRMMGLYAYLENKKGEAYRDRLQGGIQAGREIPSSGKMIKTRYLIYPQTPSFLFEARTLANDFPAAVAELKLYEVKGGRLPRLKINYPDGLEHRRIGNNDEDQTLCINMAKSDLKGLTERILEYMDYTGQDTFHYQLLRYYFSFFPYPGSNGNGLYPYLPGGMGYIIDAMHKRGKEFTGIFNLSTIPEVYYASCLGRDLSKTGMVVLDKNSHPLNSFEGVKGTPNPADPAVRAAFVRYVEDFSEDLRNPGMKAVSFWLTMGWNSLNDGYDNYTVNKFSADTGIKVPDSERYEFLTSPKILPQWSKWRATQVFELIKAVRNALDKIKPELAIYVMKRDNYDWDADLDQMLKQLPRTYACDFRRPTNYRLDFHWNRPESFREEEMYNFPDACELYKRKSNQCVSLFYLYYESFTKPLDRKNYGCYFQSADVKPHGRHFLKELAFNVAAGDNLEIVMGGQPFGSLGRDAETREFARAFAALPRQNFNTVKNPNASIVVRYLNTKNGTYFYAVSNFWSNSKVTLNWPGNAEYIDLSSGIKLDSKTIELKPYELRSFLVPDKEIAISSFSSEFPAELKEYYLKRIAELEAAVKINEARGLAVIAEKARINEIGKAVEAENYAEAHRLAWSVLMNQMLLKLKTIDLAVAQEKMIEKNHFALNCGSTDFYRTSDGRLFFPDHKFSDSSRYGYYGSYESAARKIEGLKNKTEPELFRTEAWNIDGYKFKVANGKYLVRLYMKVGWPDDFKPGKVVLSVFAQDKPLFANLDLYTAGNGDFTQPVIKDFHVVVNNGMLTLKFKAAKELGSNIQLCNAIEIIPED